MIRLIDLLWAGVGPALEGVAHDDAVNISLESEFAHQRFAEGDGCLSQEIHPPPADDIAPTSESDEKSPGSDSQRPGENDEEQKRERNHGPKVHDRLAVQMPP